MDQDCSRRSFLATMVAIGGGAVLLPAAPLLAAAPRKTVIRTPSGREVEVTRWRAESRRGTILFSHGALSSPAFYDAFILPWVASGWDVWAPLHVDSTLHPRRQSFPGLQSWRARMEDMHALAAHVGARSFVAAGHSYGGLVALTLGGASPVRPEGFEPALALPGVKAIVALSPPGPMPGLVPAGTYATVARPAFVQTGTRDITPAPAGGVVDPSSWRSHLLAHDEAPSSGNQYALVMEGVDHYFGGLICNFERPGPPQIEQAKTAAELSTRFMHAYGRASGRSRTKLDSSLASEGSVILRKK